MLEFELLKAVADLSVASPGELVWAVSLHGRSRTVRPLTGQLMASRARCSFSFLRQPKPHTLLPYHSLVPRFQRRLPFDAKRQNYAEIITWDGRYHLAVFEKAIFPTFPKVCIYL